MLSKNTTIGFSTSHQTLTITDEDGNDSTLVYDVLTYGVEDDFMFLQLVEHEELVAIAQETTVPEGGTLTVQNKSRRTAAPTANTSAVNAAIQMDVQNLLGVQQTALNNIWDHYDTLLNFTFKAEESAIDRATQLAIATLQAEAEAASAAAKAEGGLISGLFTAGASILSSDTGASWLFGK